MKISLIRRRNKEIFQSKINKKSLFLRSLPKKKYESIKKVEEGKTELIIDKILGIGEFERDYAFFSNKGNNDSSKNNLLKLNIKPSLKSRITNLVQKGNRYEDYIKEEEKNENNSNSIDNIEKYDRNKSLRSKLKRNAIDVKKNIQKPESFLSKIGNDVIISSSLLDNKKIWLNNNKYIIFMIFFVKNNILFIVRLFFWQKNKQFIKKTFKWIQ